MRVIAICGSPREDGNTSVLAREVLRGAEDSGAETKLFFANKLEMRGCQGCLSCRKDGQCVQQDDMTPLYEEIRAAGGLVFASPVYMFGITGQMKLVLDRMFAFIGKDFTSRLPNGKRLALIFTQGAEDKSLFDSLYKSVRDIMGYVGFEDRIEALVGTGLGDIGQVAKDEALLESARSLGRWLVE